MLINVLAFAVMQGLNGALETLISRSYGLSKDKSQTSEQRKASRIECGVLYNRGRFVVTVVMIPIAIIFLLSKPILIAMGQDEAVSESAQVFCSYMIPGVWAVGQFDALRKFVYSQYKTKVPVAT